MPSSLGEPSGKYLSNQQNHSPITISQHRVPWILPPINFGGVKVAESDNIKLLGVRFDQHLSFRDHIRDVATKANQRIHFMRKQLVFWTLLLAPRSTKDL